MKNYKMFGIVGIIGIVIVVGFMFIKTNSTKPVSIVATAKDTVAKNTVNQIVPSNPQDIVPGTYPNLIKNTSTVAGLVIVSGLVENNIDAQGKVTDDHLELVLKNTSTQDMSNFEVYYTVTDLTTAKSEGYYKKLTGFVLKGGESKSVHFDGKNEVNHFGINKDGLYFTSKNKLQFNVQVSTPGFQVAHLQITKDAGGAETKD
jgi:hypothetical protein